MPANAAAENVFGTIGAICWTVQLIPQLHKSHRTKSTDGLSPWLVLLWGLAGLPLGVYAIVQDLNAPLIVQPQLFGALALAAWAQCMHYGPARRSARWCVAVLAVLLVLFAALEAGCVFALRPAYRRGTPAGKAGTRFFGILSSALISLALLPQYWEIRRHRAVVGISIAFMAVDCAGGVFSDLSLVFKREFDVVAAVTYSLVVLLDGLVLVLAAVLNPRARRRARREAELAERGTGSAGTTTVVGAEAPPAAPPEKEKDAPAHVAVQSLRETEPPPMMV
ncbi:PQ loop repeat-domain-containing protein [Gloeopeniophorella convolvens]|nr:PQ loop repeat-domain-containing protein [Gloeopeniophorella convolvens]